MAERNQCILYNDALFIPYCHCSTREDKEISWPMALIPTKFIKPEHQYACYFRVMETWYRVPVFLRVPPDQRSSGICRLKRNSCVKSTVTYCCCVHLKWPRAWFKRLLLCETINETQATDLLRCNWPACNQTFVTVCRYTVLPVDSARSEASCCAVNVLWRLSCMHRNGFVWNDRYDPPTWILSNMIRMRLRFLPDPLRNLAELRE